MLTVVSVSLRCAIAECSTWRSAVSADAMDLVQMQHALKATGTKQVGQQATASQPVSPAYTAGAGRLSDSPFHADSHRHVAALVARLSNAQKQLPSKNAATTATPSIPDSPSQPSSLEHVSGLSVAKGITAPTPTHTPVLDDSPYQSTSRSHVAALAGQLLERLQSGDSKRSSLAADSPFKAKSSSHIHEMINAYHLAVAADSSPNASPQRLSAAKPQTPHNTPLTPNSEQAGHFAAYRPKLVGPDDPVQGPQIIHITYGSEAPFKSRTSQVAQLADKLVAAKAAEDVGPLDTTPNSSSNGDPGAVTLGKPAATLVVSTSKGHVGSPPSPSSPKIPDQRLRSPRSKSQLFAPSHSNNTVHAAKARLSNIAAGECAGVTVFHRAGSYLAEVAAANTGVCEASSDGANMNPLYKRTTLAAGALAESMLGADEIADLSIHGKQ